MAQLIVAGNPVNEFEKTVSRTLSHLPDDYLIISNVVLPGFFHKQSNIEIDVILVSRVGVFAIEAKYWQGSVRGHVNQKHWVVDREGNPPHTVENPLQRSEMKAKTLNTILSRWNSGLMGKLPTRAMVVVPPHTPMQIENPTDIELISLESLLPRIKELGKTLKEEATDTQVKQIAELLVGSHQQTDEYLPFENYKVQRVLKSSPYAVSFQAINTFTERQVFIKKLISDVNQPPDKLALWRNRAVREAKATSKLFHTNIIQVLDVLEDQGNIYVISEWVDGQSLAERMQAEASGALPIDEAVILMRQACQGLGYAHAKEPPIVHRDVNPTSLLVSGPAVKVTNFSHARIEGDPSIVFTEMIQGRDPAYAAPELFANASAATPASDVYGLGATLYQLLSGVKPESFLSRTPVAPLRQVAPGVPVEIEAVVAKAMSPVPAQRYPTARELGEALAAAQGDPVVPQRRASDRV